MFDSIRPQVLTIVIALAALGGGGLALGHIEVAALAVGGLIAISKDILKGD